jgi:hypothetical protein
MVITPTDKGALVAGGAFWTLLWCVLAKSDRVPVVSRYVKRGLLITWIRENGALAMIMSEVVNVSIHPPSNPASTMFAVGGSIVNASVIFGIIPMAGWVSGRRKIIS